MQEEQVKDRERKTDSKQRRVTTIHHWFTPSVSTRADPGVGGSWELEVEGTRLFEPSNLPLARGWSQVQEAQIQSRY